MPTERPRRRIPDATVARLPIYLRLLSEQADDGVDSISSDRLAELGGVNAAKVRKDLSYLGSYGTRGVGYEVAYLVYQIRRELGLTHDWPVVIVGAGNLGQALAGYGGFGERGFPVAGVVDIDEAKVGSVLGGVRVRHIDELAKIVQAKRVRIGVVATPPAAAQDAADRLVAAGDHQHLELRPGGAQRAPVDRGAQGRPGRRAADPQLLRAAPCRRHDPPGGQRDARGRPAPHGERVGWARMSIVVIGVNHRTGPLELLERVSIPGAELPKAVIGLTSRQNIREAVVLTTCNRTEVYAVAEKFHGAYADIRDFFSELSGLATDQLHAHLYSQHDEGAITHLFEVAAGLDSAVLGESEILGQVRNAWELARHEGGAKASLNLLFRTRDRGRQAGAHGDGHRSRHGVGEPRRGGDGHRPARLAGRQAGAGGRRRRHGRGHRRRAGARRGHAHQRHQPHHRARPPAGRAGQRRGRAVRQAARRPSPEADVLLTCTGAGGVLVDIDTMIAGRIGATEPLLVVDIAVPRDVAAEVTELDGVTLLNLDHLRDWADRGLAQRAGETDRVRSIVAEETEQYLLEVAARQAAPLVAQLHEHGRIGARRRAGALRQPARRARRRRAGHASTRSPRASSPSCCTRCRCA